MFGALGVDPDARPVGIAAWTASTALDVSRVDAVEDVDHLEVGEVLQSRERVGAELLAIKPDRGADRAPGIVDGLAAAADDSDDRRHGVRAHLARDVDRWRPTTSHRPTGVLELLSSGRSAARRRGLAALDTATPTPAPSAIATAVCMPGSTAATAAPRMLPRTMYATTL
jgi:hypothetical protein